MPWSFSNANRDVHSQSVSGYVDVKTSLLTLLLLSLLLFKNNERFLINSHFKPLQCKANMMQSITYTAMHWNTFFKTWSFPTCHPGEIMTAISIVYRLRAVDIAIVSIWIKSISVLYIHRHLPCILPSSLCCSTSSSQTWATCFKRPTEGCFQSRKLSKNPRNT